MGVPLSLMRHTQHIDSVGQKCIVLNKKHSFTVHFQGSMIYCKWEFIQSTKIYVGVLKVPIPFLRFSAFLKVGVCCAVKMHKITGPIFFKETVNTYKYVWLVLTPLFVDSGRRNVWSLNGGQCHILHCKPFSGCTRRNSCYAADNAQLVVP